MADARPFMHTHAAAAYLCIGWRKLRKLRVSGQGPRFRRHGRLIIYCVEDLDAWSRATIVEGRGAAALSARGVSRIPTTAHVGRASPQAPLRGWRRTTTTVRK